MPTKAIDYVEIEFPSPREVNGASYIEKLGYTNSFEMFPFPPEVTRVSYQRVILRMRKTTLCFRTLSKRLGVLTIREGVLGESRPKFPYPLGVTRGSYKWC